MKGAYPADELEVVSAEYELKAVYPLVVPGLAEQRHLVEIMLRQVAGQHKTALNNIRDKSIG
jgi:hypothetical protein